MILVRSGGHQRRFSEWETRNSGDRASTFKSQLRGTSLQKREELNFAVRSTVAKFRIDFYKDVCCVGWRDICSALCVEALISNRNAGHELTETLINRRRQHDVPKCSVRLYDPYFICI